MIVHRFWWGPNRDLSWSRSVIESVLGYSVNDWTPETLPAGARWVLESKYPRAASNRLRYWLLDTFGGLWMDHDVIPLKPFPTDVWTAALGQDREGSVLSFPDAHHPMMEELLRAVRAAPAHASPAQLTGARVLTLVGKRYSDVRLEPRVLPFDALGRPTGVTDPLAIHLWETSAQIHGGAHERAARA